MKNLSTQKQNFVALYLLCVLAVLSLDSCRTARTTQSKAEDLNQNARSAKTEKLLKTALSYKGTNYKAGGTDKHGMDCSGLVITSYLQIELNLPRTSKEQSAIGSSVKKEEAKEGDLIFFATSGKEIGINHVGIITSVDNDMGLRFIHSSVKGGVMEDSMNESYYQKTFVKVMRVY